MIALPPQSHETLPSFKGEVTSSSRARSRPSPPEEIELLFELSERSLFPKNIVYQSLTKYAELKAALVNMAEKNKTRKNKTKKFSDKQLVAFALFITLIDNEIPKRPTEICQYFQMRVKKLFEVERYLHFLPRSHTISDYLDRFVSLLKLPYSFCKELKELSLQMYGMGGTSPQCLAVSLIYLYCHFMSSSPLQQQQQSTLEKIKGWKNTKLSLRNICNICNVSSANIRRNMKSKQLQDKVFKILREKMTSSAASTVVDVTT